MVFKKSEKMDQRLKVMATMPPQHHKLPDQAFSYEKSEVLQWLSQQPELIEYLFTVVSRKGFIVYDSKTKKWQGTDWIEANDD